MSGNDEQKGGGEPQDETQDQGKAREVPPEQRPNLTQADLNKLIDAKFSEAFEKATSKVQGEMLSRLGASSIDELEEKVRGGKQSAAGDDEKAEAVREALDSARKEWSSTQSELEKSLAEKDTLINRMGVETALVNAATKAAAHDPDDVVRALSNRLRVNLKSGRVEVLTDGGNVAIGSDGDPLTVDDAVLELRGKKPHLFRDSTRPGSGERAGEGANPKNTISRREWDSMNPLEQAEKIRAGIKPVD